MEEYGRWLRETEARWDAYLNGKLEGEEYLYHKDRLDALAEAERCARCAWGAAERDYYNALARHA